MQSSQSPNAKPLDKCASTRVRGSYALPIGLNSRFVGEVFRIGLSFWPWRVPRHAVSDEQPERRDERADNRHAHQREEHNYDGYQVHSQRPKTRLF
jgi:hypothetical protein